MKLPILRPALHREEPDEKLIDLVYPKPRLRVFLEIFIRILPDYVLVNKLTWYIVQTNVSIYLASYRLLNWIPRFEIIPNTYNQLRYENNYYCYEKAFIQ